MKKILLSTTFLVAGLLTGAIAERGLAPDGSKRDGEARKTASGKTSTRDEAKASRAGAKDGPRTRHDLATLLRWRQLQEVGNAEQLREIERMEDAELKSLLADFGARMKEAGGETAAMIRSMELAARELYKREGEAALVWASTQEQGRQAMLSQMISAAAHEDPALALPWIDRFTKEFGRDYVNTMGTEAVRGATSRGAEALLKLRELYGERLRGTPLTSGPFPEDFDFHRFVTATKGNVQLQSTVQYWAAKDKEAAWLGLKEGFGDKANRLDDIGAAFAGVAMMEGDKKAAEWLIPKLDEVPADKRDNAIRALRRQGMMTDESVRAIMPLLRDEGERITLAAASISPWGSSGIGALQCLANDESREEALGSMAETYQVSIRQMNPAQKERTTQYLSTMMDELKFSTERKERVMRTLLPED